MDAKPHMSLDYDLTFQQRSIRTAIYGRFKNYRAAKRIPQAKCVFQFIEPMGHI